MKTQSAFARCFAILPFAVALLPSPAIAQQLPVTGQMMGQGSAVADAPMQAAVAAPQASTAVTTPLNDRRYVAAPPASQPATSAAPAAPAYVASSAAVPPAVEQPRPHATIIGETTQNLLQMQVDGSQAGKHLPMLGAEASASYDRYLKSFNHDIPEFYKTTVGKDSNSSNSGGGE